MDLIRDVLDNQLVDRNGRYIGRVDGLVVDVTGGGPPRVIAIEQGSVTLARRLHPRFAAWWMRVARRLFHLRLTPVRIGVDRVRDIGVDITLDVDGDADPRLLKREKWISRRFISRIPGATKKQQDRANKEQQS